MLTDDESNYSDEENVEKIVSQAPKRLGEQVKKSNAKKVSKTKKVKNVDKYLRPGTIPQNKIKVSYTLFAIFLAKMSQHIFL
jgi:hypothetical protein